MHILRAATEVSNIIDYPHTELLNIDRVFFQTVLVLSIKIISLETVIPEIFLGTVI